jgi:hypothetical protein
MVCLLPRANAAGWGSLSAMKNASYLALALLGLAACGDDGGTSGGADAPPVSQSVMVMGIASEVTVSGRVPTAGVMVSAFKEGETASIVTATTDAAGAYTLIIPTDGMPLDGYLLGKLAGKKDTYLYPPRPISADLPSAPVLILTQATFDAAATIAQTPQVAGMGWVGIQVFDSANMAVAGVTVSSSPAGTVRYNGPTNGLPSKTATSTADDGIAYIFSVAPGTVTISASGGTGNLSYHSHTVNARPDTVTTTLIQP